MGVVPDEIKTVLGSDPSREAVMQLFELFQHPKLNKRLAIVTFEGLLRRMYPQINWDEALGRLLLNARNRSGSEIRQIKLDHVST